MRQHFVPQFLIKNFSTNKDSTKVYAYKRGEDPFITSIINVNVKKDLYTTINKITGKKDYGVEEGFANIEGRTAKIINLINGNCFIDKLTSEDIGILSYFIALLYIRTLSFRRHHLDSIDEITKLYLNENLPKDLSREILDYRNNFDFSGKKNKDNLLDDELELAEKINTELLNKEWYIICNNTPRVFITSDNPIAVIRPKHLPLEYGNGGIGNSHTMLTISPQKAIFLKSALKVNKKLNVASISREEVRSMNRKIMATADNFIYANLNSRDLKNDFHKTDKIEYKLTIQSKII